MLTLEPLAFNYPGLDLYSGTYEDPREANAPRPYSSSPLYPPYSRGRRARDDPPRIPRPRFPSAIRSNSLVSENASELRRSLARSESLGLSRLETEVPRPTLFHPRSPSPLFTMDESHLFDGEVPSMDLDVPFSSQAAALFASRSNSPPPPAAQELRFRREVRANAPRLPQVFAPSPPPSGDRMDDNAPIRRFLGGSTLWRTHEEARRSMERESWTTSRPHPSADLRRRATTREATAQSTRTSIPSSVPRARQTARPPPTMSRNAVNVPHDRHHMDVNAFHEGPFRSSIERQIEINRLQSRIEHLQAGLGTEAPRGSSPQLPPPPPPPPSIPPVQIDWEPLDPWEGINSTQIPERPEPSAIFRETLTRQVNASTRTRSRFAWDGPVNRESRHIRNNTTDVTRDDDASGDPAMHRHLQSTVGRRSTTTSPWILPRAPSGPEDFTRIRDTIAMLRSESRDLRRDFDVNAYPQPEERRTSRPPHWGEMEATDVSNRPASIRRRFPTRVPGPGLGETPSGTESIPPSRRPRSASVSRLHTAATRSGQTGTTRADMSVERYIALRPGGLGGRRARLGRNLADFIVARRRV
ncbi:hypothetical protein OF83DRAFT_94996 [Amylostereum chailletii]|nr:hypothetical protein OF83DRAFT_94996 [Amylostereum chailletii]